MGRVSRNGWIVLESTASADESWCVDFLEDPAGGFGFEHFRSDPEDGGARTAVGGFSGVRHETLAAAIEAATVAIPWFSRT